MKKVLISRNSKSTYFSYCYKFYLLKLDEIKFNQFYKNNT